MTTQFEIDSALMAGMAYRSTRAVINRFPLPEGWSEVPASHVELPSGFEAVSFTEGSRIVISYAGTGPSLSDWDANSGLALGLGSGQLREAALYYIEVKSANPGATISFTGHSLGGGLAALMGVFFDEQAVTFDQAPFSASHTVGIRDDLIAYLNAHGYDNAALNALVPELLVYDPIAADTNPALNRLDNLTSYYVQGDVLHELPVSPPFYPLGFQIPIQHGGTGVDSIDLHAQSLLAAFLENDTFRAITFSLPELLKMVFDEALYYRDPNNTDNPEHNLLEHLLRHQIGIAADPSTGTAVIPADAMLDRFTADLQKIAQAGGFTLTNQHVANTLVAFAMQFYYENADAAVAGSTLYDTITGGIRFDRTDVSATLSGAKGWQLYFQNYLNTLTLEEHRIVLQLLPAATDWFIQAGNLSMSATADISKAFMVGGTGNDWMRGGSQADLLIGNAGDDTINGGAGNDTLMGGQGYDTYIINAGDGHDTLLDSDGQGVINLDGVLAKGKTTVTDPSKWIQLGNVWQDQEHGITYGLATLADGSQTLFITGLNGSTVEVKGWSDGDLGIDLGAGAQPSAAPTPATGTTIEGDLKPHDHDPQAAGIQEDHDSLGNVIVGSEAAANRQDTLYDSTGNDHLLGHGGNDTLHAWRGGDDLLEGGAGQDTLSGGAGHDLLAGGTDSDVLIGGAGDDHLFAQDQTNDLAAAILAAETQAGSGGRGDWLSGDDGTDTLVGDAGNDVLLGGEGADLLIGGGGNDNLYGDEQGNASIDWTLTRQIIQQGSNTLYYTDIQNGGTVLATVGGADVIYGGAGNDWIEGGQGNDIIDAGADDDIVFGGQGSDLILGQAGNDILIGNAGVNAPESDGGDYIDGGTGDDQIWGGGGNDILLGGDGDDVVYGDGNGTSPEDEGATISTAGPATTRSLAGAGTIPCWEGPATTTFMVKLATTRSTEARGPITSMVVPATTPT